MTTQTSELFTKPTHRHLFKDVVLVTLVAALTAGFLVHALRPGPKAEHAAVTAAVLLARK
jgi:hypothetical protein